MKIIRLSADRIKVFLSVNDLLEMNIDADALSPTSSQLGAFLYDVLTAVRRETGFGMEEGQVVAEATPVSGGLELMLSHAKEAPESPRSSGVAFEFRDKESLLSAIGNISPSYLSAMRLYTYDGSFYLSVPRRKIPAVVYEYSFKNYKSYLTESFLCEHATLLADGYRLLCMYFGIKKMN